MPDQPSREEELFKTALRFATPQERAAYLKLVSADDAALLNRLMARLQAHEQAGDSLTVEGTELPDMPKAETLTEKAGESIGRYKLLQKINEGGMGVVYMAEQGEPVRRRVALKIIKLGMDTKQVIARFEAERQALALMDHPNIAKVFDAGATGTGRPFFVMELVKGIRITDYCDQNNVATRARLELFIQVCHAIQHAHQKGIIHRDIKPSNILVTLHDGVPVPKIIDFGIAKATSGQRLTDKTLFTAFEQFVGTPVYMSPEQAEMSGLDIDTRTDIYALGVLLYELLTGKTPFDAKRLQRVALDEIRRIIREEEPLRPSTRLSTLDAAEQTTVAKHRQSEPPKLLGIIRGDLDWIVMKALEKDRTRRYETANGLAIDIKCHLDNEPVVARPPSKLYRFQKLVHRNKLVFAAAATVALALLAGFVVSIWFYTREADAHRRALIAEGEQRQLREAAEAARRSETLARQQAEAEAKKSADVLRFTQNMVARAGQSYADQVTVLQMLNWGAADVAGKFRDQPDVSASVQYSIGICYSKIGRWDEARKYLQRALELQDHLYGYVNPDTLDTARELASVALSQGQKEEAKALCQKILDSARAGSAKNQRTSGDKVRFRNLELWACRKLTQAYLEEGKLSQAKPLVEELVKAAKANEFTDSQEAGIAWDEAGTFALEEGRPQEALEAFDAALHYFGETSIVQQAWSDGMRGAAYIALGEYEKAEPLITNSLPTLRKRFGDSHFRVQRAFRDLVSLYTKTGRPDQAAEWKKKLDEAEAVLPESGPATATAGKSGRAK